MPVPHVATERRSDEPMWAIRVMVEAYLKRNHAFFAQIETLDNVMLLPIPEVQVVTVFVRSHIFQVEAFRKRIRRSPSTAHHHIVAWLIPVVIVEAHALSVLFPTACNIELLVEQKETARTIALTVSEHRDHNVTVVLLRDLAQKHLAFFEPSALYLLGSCHV